MLTIASCLKDTNSAVRDCAACIIGQIGLPEGITAIDHLLKAINDVNSDVKSKVIWAIGKLADECNESVI